MAEWTKQDVKDLRRLHRKHTDADVAYMLGRTTDAVKKKASRMGLTKNLGYLRSLGRKV